MVFLKGTSSRKATIETYPDRNPSAEQDSSLWKLWMLDLLNGREIQKIQFWWWSIGVLSHIHFWNQIMKILGMKNNPDATMSYLHTKNEDSFSVTPYSLSSIVFFLFFSCFLALCSIARVSGLCKALWCMKRVYLQNLLMFFVTLASVLKRMPNCDNFWTHNATFLVI